MSLAKLRVLFKSTAVRLSAFYILLFAFCAGFLVLYVTAMSERLLATQMRDTLQQEVGELKRVERRGGLNLLMRMMEQRARQPGANLYVIASPAGEILAGNVASLQPGVLDKEGWTQTPFRYKPYSESGDARIHVATANVFVLNNGLRVMIGRDLGEPEKLRYLVRQALMVALAIMGVGAVVIWFAIGRNALRRIDRMSESLNAMLGRIERLNEGLRQVSDNIAHDLKTPLTRLRNKAADALDCSEANGRRAALEGIIAESDQLIRTFDALLMISRVEAGSAAAEMSGADLSAIVSDSLDLYEPVAEETGLTLSADIEPGVTVHGNRELIGQAIFNLIDNAIKYSAGDGGGSGIRLNLVRTASDVRLSVADTGPGVPPDRREDVIKRFVRLDESRSKPGTGLGLSLVDAVADLHGGRLELSDTNNNAAANRGLTVTMVFPLVRDESR